jgi:putative endonuclease
MIKQYYLYILSNKKNGTLYTGFTDDLERRMREHKMKDVDGFTKRYDLDKLMYFEKNDTSNEAFLRERRIKKWKRAWKIALIEKDNPEWKDLSKEWE